MVLRAPPCPTSAAAHLGYHSMFPTNFAVASTSYTDRQCASPDGVGHAVGIRARSWSPGLTRSDRRSGDSVVDAPRRADRVCPGGERSQFLIECLVEATAEFVRNIEG